MIDINKFLEIIKNVNTFEELKETIKDYDKTDKGNIFELFTKYMFLIHSNFRTITKNIYLYDEIPVKLKKKNNLPERDKGIDLLLETIDNEFYPIQCKYRTNENIKVNWTNLSTFVGQAFGIANFKKAIYVTNTYSIDDEIARSGKIQCIYGDFFTNDNFNRQFFDNLRNHIRGNKLKYEVYEPWQHQKEFVQNTIDHFKDNERGTAVIACGCGKTNATYLLDKEMNNNLTLVLVPSATIKQLKLDIS